MNILIAFDSFKGCMTADEACDSAGDGALGALPSSQVRCMPLSDGGEGLVQCVRRMKDVQLVTIHAHGPLMEQVEATYAISDDGVTAYMEMASTSGLPLVPMDKRNPLNTTTYGVGDLLIDATRRGCRHVIMGIGGSATCDGGKGMIQCLRDNGFDMSADAMPRITVACDVTNPLYGENGAAYVFAPQKGATPEQVVALDNRLRAFAEETEECGNATRELALCPGTGAAGGLGYGLVAYLSAELRSGIDIVLDICNFDEAVNGADIIITGEGKSDSQTLMGKVPQGVLKRAGNTPVFLVSGAIEDKDMLLSVGFASVTSINEGDARPLDVLLKNEVAKQNMVRHVKNVLHTFIG